jgi:hypothetical protein
VDLSYGVLCLEGLWCGGLHVILRCELWCLYFALGVCPRESLPCTNEYWLVRLKLLEDVELDDRPLDQRSKSVLS